MILIKTKNEANKKIVVNISLLYLASQLGKNISKFSRVEAEYFLAIKVSGQNILNKTNKIPSPSTRAIETQVKVLILFITPE